MSPTATDQELLVAAGRGDHRAFRELMTRHVSFAMALALRMTGNLPDAEEIVQEAFLRVWNGAGRWQPERGARFTTWLYRVVLNLCLDRRRRPVMLPVDGIEEPADPSATGFDSHAASESRRLVAEALQSLPDRQRMALSLCYFGGLGYAEAAEIMDVTPSALDSLLVRGRRRLREYLTRRGLEALGDLV